MSPHKAKDEDEEDTSNVNEFHGHPLLWKTDMTEEMAYDVNEVCINACEKYINDRRNNGRIAKYIKEKLDSRYPCGPPSAWHVVAGERFSFDVVYEEGSLLYMFFSARVAICVWRI